jgi:hypothetical protein
LARHTPERTKRPDLTAETVENLGVLTPLNEMNARSNRRLRHVGGQGAARPV